jgi:hypothetical protein
MCGYVCIYLYKIFQHTCSPSNHFDTAYLASTLLQTSILFARPSSSRDTSISRVGMSQQ